MVIFTSKQPLALGSFVQVKITEALPHDVIGEALC
ncbi:TRAM domain-containing protein [Longicatena caecimuris]